MKKIILLISTLYSFLFSVGEAGAIFLLISPSPEANGYGGSGVSAPTFDPYSSYYNPAHSLIPTGVSIKTSYTKTDWLPNLADDLYTEYKVMSIGYNGYDLGKKFKLQFSISGLKTYLNLGEQQGMDQFGNETGLFKSYMYATSQTVSFGIQSNKYPILFTIGRTSKTATQVLTDPSVGFDSGSGTSVDTFNDWGFRFLLNDFKFSDASTTSITYGLGYSKSNIGDFIVFLDPDQGDPAPTTARLGMTFGLKIHDVLNLKVIREVEDLLVASNAIAYDSLGNVIEIEKFYQESLLGDINIAEHIFNGKANEYVTIHNGIELTLFDFCSVRIGRLIDIAGNIDVDTYGFGINIKNCYNFFYPSSRNNIFNYLNLEYNFSKDSAGYNHARDNISYSNLSISINLDKLSCKNNK